MRERSQLRGEEVVRDEDLIPDQFCYLFSLSWNSTTALHVSPSHWSPSAYVFKKSMQTDGSYEHQHFVVPLGLMDQKANFETVIAINENGESAAEDVAARTQRETSPSCSIEVDQRVCRICHLSDKESGDSRDELIELGCECRGEMGVAHSQCAEAWFRVKGNRLCEICGEAARNVSGVCDTRFMEEWSDGRWIDGGYYSNNTSDGSRGRCLQGQPFCNLLMACLVIAFILPWFFRVNLF